MLNLNFIYLFCGERVQQHCYFESGIYIIFSAISTKSVQHNKYCYDSCVKYTGAWVH